MRRMRTVGAAVLVLVLAGCWPAQYQGPDRSGWNPAESTITVDTADSLQTTWTTTLEGSVIHIVSWGSSAYVVARDGSLYGYLHAISLADGSIRWSQPSPYRFVWRSPLVDEEKVLASYYAVGATSRTFDAATGAQLATRSGEVSSMRQSTSLVEQALPSSDYSEGTLSFTVEDEQDPGATWGGTLAVVNPFDVSQSAELSLGSGRVYGAGYGLMSSTPGDGTQGFAARMFSPDQPATCGPAGRAEYACPAWVTPIDGPSHAVPVIGPGEQVVYVTTDAGTLYALDAATGAVDWSAAVGARANMPPAVADGFVYVPTASGGVSVLAAGGCGAATCSPLWTATTSGVVTGQPAVGGGVVYVGTDTGAVQAFDAAGCGAASCTALWSSELGSGVTASPIVTTGRLLVGTADGRLVEFRPAATTP